MDQQVLPRNSGCSVIQTHDNDAFTDATAHQHDGNFKSLTNQQKLHAATEQAIHNPNTAKSNSLGKSTAGTPTTPSQPSSLPFFDIIEEISDDGTPLRSEAINVTQRLQLLQKHFQHKNNSQDEKEESNQQPEIKNRPAEFASATATPINGDDHWELNDTADEDEEFPRKVSDAEYQVLSARLDELARLETEQQKPGKHLKSNSISPFSKVNASTPEKAPVTTTTRPTTNISRGWAKGFLLNPKKMPLTAKINNNSSTTTAAATVKTPQQQLPQLQSASASASPAKSCELKTVAATTTSGRKVRFQGTDDDEDAEKKPASKVPQQQQEPLTTTTTTTARLPSTSPAFSGIIRERTPQPSSSSTPAAVAAQLPLERHAPVARTVAPPPQHEQTNSQKQPMSRFARERRQIQ